MLDLIINWCVTLVCLVVLTGSTAWSDRAEAAAITLPKTGQTGCWDISGNPVACAGTGQDGDKLKGTAWPNPRFTDQGNGTVLDNLTGLVWLKNADCFGLQNWQTALTSSNTLAAGACSLTDSSVAGDWRLPNRNELRSLIDRQNYNPVLPTSHLFSAVQSDGYWSSSRCAGLTNCVWAVNMGLGFVDLNDAGLYYYVWPVRGGQLGNSVISASPVSKDFGTIITGTKSAAQMFTISNSGSVLIVSDISTTGGDSGMFSIDPGTGTGGTCGSLTPTIALGTSCTVSVAFSPSSTGAKSTTLRIASNDPATPNKDIALSGTGAAAVTTYTVGTGIVGSGTVNCTPTTVNSGDTSSCAATATTPGNHIGSISGCGISYTGSGNTDTTQTIATAAISGDCTVTGTFAVNSYTVSFNSNGGSVVGSQSINYNATASQPSAPTKTGYSFGGWYSDAGLTTAFNFVTAITGDITLYAKWTINSYTVSFNSNGGSAVNSQIVTYNATAAQPAAPTRTGYSFGGWYLDAGLTQAFNFATAITGDITLYAKWNINSYTVTFISGGNGTLSGTTSQTVNHGGSTSAVSAIPDAGYHFVNWTGAGFTPSSANPLTIANITTALTVTANFAINPVVINNGAAGTSNTAVTLTLTSANAASMQFLIDKASAWTKLEPFNASKQVKLPSGNGIKTVAARFVDTQGTISPIYSATIFLDAAAPVGGISIENGAGSTANSTLSLQLSASDSASGTLQMRFCEDGKSWLEDWAPFSASASYTLGSHPVATVTPGIKKVYVQFRDAAGKLSKTYSDSISYSPQAADPGLHATVIINGGAAYTRSKTVSLTLAPPNGEPYVRLANDLSALSKAKWLAVASVGSWNLAAGDGVKTVYAQYSGDQVSPTGTYNGSITLDTKAPTGWLLINDGAPVTASATVALTMGASDVNGVDAMCLREDASVCQDNEWGGYASGAGHTFSSTSDGTKNLFVSFRDMAGNVSKPLKAGITLDTSAPSGTVSINGGKPTTASPVVTLKFSAAKAVYMQLSLDDGASWGEWEAFVTSKNVTLAAGAGVKVVKAKFRDFAGNVSAECSATITLL